MIGYFIGGTSVGLLSLQAYKRRQENKKNAALSQEVAERILAPSEWSQGEDVYILKSQMLSEQLNANSTPLKKRTYFQQTRAIFSEQLLRFRLRQQLLFTHFNPISEEIIPNTQTPNHNPEPYQKDIQTSALRGIYNKFLANKLKRNKEKQLGQLKNKIITPQREGTNLEAASQKEVLLMKKRFNESTISKQSVVYTEYKGEDPNQALKNFLLNCRKHIPVKKAMIIHYIFGKGNPNSYILGKIN